MYEMILLFFDQPSRQHKDDRGPPRDECVTMHIGDREIMMMVGNVLLVDD